MTKYGIENGQVYDRADGTKTHWLTVIDCESLADKEEVIVKEPDGTIRTVDAFKLAVVRYYRRDVDTP